MLRIRKSRASGNRHFLRFALLPNGSCLLFEFLCSFPEGTPPPMMPSAPSSNGYTQGYPSQGEAVSLIFYVFSAAARCPSNPRPKLSTGEMGPTLTPSGRNQGIQCDGFMIQVIWRLILWFWSLMPHNVSTSENCSVYSFLYFPMQSDWTASKLLSCPAGAATP